MTLQEIHTKYDTDKGTVHSYIPIYDNLFAPFQNKPINLLEIGALTCGSLKMFSEYFESGTIYGIDNWTQWWTYDLSRINVQNIISDVKTNWPRINLITSDSTDKKSIDTKLQGLKFDIILDDGNHDPQVQFKTFTNLIEYLNQDTGIYIIEDIVYVIPLKLEIEDYIKTHKLPLVCSTYFSNKYTGSDDNLIIIKPKPNEAN